MQANSNNNDFDNACRKKRSSLSAGATVTKKKRFYTIRHLVPDLGEVPGIIRVVIIVLSTNFINLFNE